MNICTTITNTFTTCLSRLRPPSSNDETPRTPQTGANPYQELGSPRGSSSRPTALQLDLVEASRSRSRSNSVTSQPSTPLARAGVAQPTADEFQILADAGVKLRSALAECKETNDYSAYGQLVKINGTEALELPNTDEGIKNFRSLLSASKRDTGMNGVAVLVRKPEGYEGARMFVLTQDNGATVGGVTREGTAISICKGSGKVEGKDNRFAEIMDLLYEVNDKANGSPLHFACLPSIARIYNQKCGAEMFAVCTKPVDEHTPGFTDAHKAHFKPFLEKFVLTVKDNGKEVKIGLPLVGMRVNPELRDQIKENGPLKQPSQDFTDFSNVPQFATAPDMYATAQVTDVLEKTVKQVVEQGTKGQTTEAEKLAA
jgi:hypothetical protein